MVTKDRTLSPVRDVPDPAVLGLDWPDIALARADVARLRGRLAAAYAALGTLRQERVAAEEADKAARQAAAKAGKPMPSASVPAIDTRRQAAQELTDAYEGALAEAERDLRDAIMARLDDLQEDAAELAEQRRQRYGQAVLAMAEARLSYGEAQGLALFLADFPNGRLKTAGGRLRNQPSAQATPIFDHVLAALQADAQPSSGPRELPAYAAALQPREAEIGVSGTPNMEPARK